MFIAIPKEALALNPLPHGFWNCRIYLGQSKGQVHRIVIQGNERLEDYKIYELKDA